MRHHQFNISILLFSIFCFWGSNISFSQSIDKKSKKLYEQGSYLVKARKFYEGIDLLEQAVAKSPTYLEAWIKLGIAYKTLNMHNKHIGDMKRVFTEVAKLDADNPARVGVYYDLAEIYFNEGSYSVSKKYLDLIKKYPEQDKKIYINATYLLQKVDFSIEGIKKPLDFNPVMMSEETVNRYAFNSRPVLTADQKTMVLSVRNNIGNMDENVVYCEFINGEWQASKNISEFINTPRNEGMATISGDGRTLVFTSCYREDSKGGCDLYISHKHGDHWSQPENLGYNVNSTHKESEASLSADGRTIYFSSSRHTGWGLDLYKTTQDEKGEWLPAVNLGTSINTKYNETTPFIHADGNHLYFSSDGHLGFGGYDNFVSEIKKDEYSLPVNLGYPLNTHDNEGALYINPDYAKGYFEKYEKKGSESRSLVYNFDYPESIRGKFLVKYLEGKVFDNETKKALSATIELTNIGLSERNQFIESDDETGKYLVVLKDGEDYALHVEKAGYLFYSKNFDFSNHKEFDNQNLDIYLEPIKKGKLMTLSNIFYETDKFELTPKSKTELLKLVNLLNANPSLSIEIEGHTDNQGSAAHNKELSTNRAGAVYRFLIEKGVSATRLKYQGYSSTKSVASNDTEEGRKQNRRIEIKVL